MRYESEIISISWIPSEAATSGIVKAGLITGVGHVDDPPPDVIEDLAALYEAGRFRFANHLAAWIEVTDGNVVDCGYAGRGYISGTQAWLGTRRHVTFRPVEFPEIKAAPEITDLGARFVQTTGGRTGVPLPRAVSGKPYAQWRSPTVWTTLTLTIGTDGSAHGEMAGASTFPQHWVYDDRRRLVAKSGLADFHEWASAAYGSHSPWGHEDSQPLLTVAESALERQLSATIMHGGARPAIRKLAEGTTLTEQGERSDDIYLLLDGVLSVSVDGTIIGELGPGAVVGERATLHDGRRTATLRAVTKCIVAVAAAKDQISQQNLADLAELHHRENDPLQGTPKA